MYYLCLLKIFSKKAIKGMMTYRWSFLINCISQALDYAVSFLLMWIMISAFGDMKGWNSYEIMLLYAFSLFSYGIAGTFFFKILVDLPEMIHTGRFDDILVKPVRVLPYLISSNFMCNYIAHIILSIIIMVICFEQVGVWPNIFQIAFILLQGSLVYAALFLIVSGSAFWAVKIDFMFEIMYFFREVSYYPLSIFPLVIQVIMTCVIPYGMINYFPLSMELGKAENVFGSEYAGYYAVYSILFFVVACIYFSKCSKLYRSTGS